MKNALVTSLQVGLETRPHHLSFVLALGLAACGAPSASDPAAATETTAAGQSAGSEAQGTTDATSAEALSAAIAGSHRSEAHRARDAWRHPLETLSFFGIRQNMTVVELAPGGEGWYTEILAPFLRGHGKLIAAGPSLTGPGAKYAQPFHDKLLANPELYSEVTEAVLEPPTAITLGEPGSADMVVTFRNSHGWINNGVAGYVYSAAFQVLKSGGVLGVEQHRAAEGANVEESAKQGYVPEAALIATIEAAGFRFDGKSEINANPADTKDYENGVWALPPTLRGGDVDREKYTAIGESDRMTLRFVKP